MSLNSAILSQLRCLKDAVCKLNATVAGGAGSATEVTQLALLAAVMKHQDYEFLLVRDPGAADLVVRQIIEYDETTDAFTISYTLVDGTPYVPVGTPVYEDNSAILVSILTALSNIETAVEAGQSAAITSLTVSSTDTNFVNSSSVDLDLYSTISFVPNITTAAGTKAYYKIQWSFDNTNWFDETIDVAAAIVSFESAIEQGTMIRSVLSGSTGYKPLSAITLTKRARYIRVSQRSDAAATTIETTYDYQLLK